MTIERKIQTLAESAEFSVYPYIFDNPYRLGEIMHQTTFPCILGFLPKDGTVTIRNGRMYDVENIMLGFIDAVPHDADGEDNARTYNAMKVLAFRFIDAMRTSGYFRDVTLTRYEIVYDKFADIVTGIFVYLRVENLPVCPDNITNDEDDSNGG